ncbi:hypothetical protein [Sphingopyxis sp. QXT-31]|uniref:hypothetical protein n=1 Tax=Sphingopyxis sp. QXT-31 TaxID=1357916 RepID=UPI0012EBDBFA|nr:hypothetical protein [Sphingopyxis sp. QXT-31]
MKLIQTKIIAAFVSGIAACIFVSAIWPGPDSEGYVLVPSRTQCGEISLNDRVDWEKVARGRNEEAAKNAAENLHTYYSKCEYNEILEKIWNDAIESP